jgi:hypothetical protein
VSRASTAARPEAFTEPRAVTVNTSGETIDWYGTETPKRLN